ncbi:MAG: hypothetical protein ACREKM_03630 [Longimicrobiales bacterium]
MVMTRPGFGLAEAIVALVVFAVGALGAAALTAHAARMATRAVRYESALLQAVTLLDSLAADTAQGNGTRTDRHALYRWSVTTDSAARSIEVLALVRASTDTIRLRARRPPRPLLLQGTP